MGWIKKNKYNIYLFIFSISMSLIILEVAVRFIFPHTPTFGSFFPGLIVDGFKTNVSGYVRNDMFMPFASKSNFSHTITSVYRHPKPFKVSLDHYGYRNKNIRDSYEDVLVGDSFAFGYGVNDDETISSLLNKHSPTYNLAIPGAGPAMYMHMIESFLNRCRTERVTILFHQNDFYNISMSYWAGLDPRSTLDSKIYREDATPLPEHANLMFYAPLVRDSFLISLIYAIAISKNPGYQSDDFLYKQYKIVSNNAIADIEKIINYKEKVLLNKERALKYLNELLTHKRCVNEKIKAELSKLIIKVKKDNIEDIYPITRRITQYFINSGCYPISSELENLVPNVNYYAGYFYENLNGIRSGKYKGNINNLILLAKGIKKRHSQLSKDVDSMITHLIKMDSIDAIKGTSKKIYSFLQKTSDIHKLKNKSDSDKIEIFLSYLAYLKKNGQNVEIFFIPAEYNLQNSLTTRKGDCGLCDRAAKYGITCYDFTPYFLDHYSNKNNNALYLDGSHLTVEGNRRVASWIMHKRGVNNQIFLLGDG